MSAPGVGTVDLGALAGTELVINRRAVIVEKKVGEGGFAYVYLVRDGSVPPSSPPRYYCLKASSLQSPSAKQVADNETEVLRCASRHPNIVKLLDSYSRPSGRGRVDHFILMEYAEGGHLFAEVKAMAAGQRPRYSLSSLLSSFGQICSAVSFLHSQGVTHRDLKPENFLRFSDGACKLCDFGSCVRGDVPVTNQKERADAEDDIGRTTTQMYRAPEMVDLYTVSALTNKTDVWALGCCLYTMAFLKNTFEEGSNLAILNAKYAIPPPGAANPYSASRLPDLLERMLTVDVEARSTIDEVLQDARTVAAGEVLPPRPRQPGPSNSGGGGGGGGSSSGAGRSVVGKFRTDGQGVGGSALKPVTIDASKKALDPNSAAARRIRDRGGVVAGSSLPSSSSFDDDRGAAATTTRTKGASNADLLFGGGGGGGSEAVQGGGNPFGAGGGGGNSDPFGGGGGSSDPFGAGGGGSSSDPWGGGGSNSDPFGGGDAFSAGFEARDPFGDDPFSKSRAPAPPAAKVAPPPPPSRAPNAFDGADLFGEDNSAFGRQAAIGGNPFDATAAAADPFFGSSSFAEDPFSNAVVPPTARRSSKGNFGSQGASLFNSAMSGQPISFDNFASNSGGATFGSSQGSSAFGASQVFAPPALSSDPFASSLSIDPFSGAAPLVPQAGPLKPAQALQQPAQGVSRQGHRPSLDPFEAAMLSPQQQYAIMNQRMMQMQGGNAAAQQPGVNLSPAMGMNRGPNAPIMGGGTMGIDAAFSNMGPGAMRPSQVNSNISNFRNSNMFNSLGGNNASGFK